MQRRRISIGKLLSLFLLTFVCLTSLLACTTKTLPPLNAPYQENLKTKCPHTNLPLLKNTTGEAAAELLIDLINLYGECAARHNQLIDEINKQEELHHAN